MKKIIVVFIVLFVFIQAGCTPQKEIIKPIKKEQPVKKEEPLPFTMDIEQISINDSEFGFEVVLNKSVEEYNGKHINRYGILYGELDEINELTNETAYGFKELTVTNQEEYNFAFSITDDFIFTKPLVARVYIVNSDEEITLSVNTTTFSIYDLAKKDTSSFAKRIIATVEGYLLENISISVDTKLYEATTEGEGYLVALYTDYNIIRLTITIDEAYFFHEDTVLVVNDETISSLKWMYTDGVITYEFNDPNWTKPY